MYGGVEIKLHAFLSVALDGDEWSGTQAILPLEKEPLIPAG
jgi:hypothetical protein